MEQVELVTRMLPFSPQEAYRRVEFDARVNGASPDELVHVCYDQLVAALGTALHAAQIGDNGLKSRSITRALTAVTALQLGVAGEAGIARALNQLYASARRALLDSTVAFDSAQLRVLRDDFREIAGALRAS